jgi:hypothetical protein
VDLVDYSGNDRSDRRAVDTQNLGCRDALLEDEDSFADPGSHRVDRKEGVTIVFALRRDRLHGNTQPTARDVALRAKLRADFL